MPLSPTELQGEHLGQLRRLVQSPGWDLYKAHVLKRVESSEREKAKFLREGKSLEAMAQQHRIDGMKDSLDTIHQYMEGIEELLTVEDPAPTY